MPFSVTQEEGAALEAAQQRSSKVRHWRRYQAVLLRADGLLISSRGVKTPGLSHGEETPRAVRRSRPPDTKRPGVRYVRPTAGPAGRYACGGGFGPRHDRVRRS